jgi:predicted nucleic acid-binding protein
MPPGITTYDVLNYLRYLASIAYLQDVHFLWRPFLRDPDDDMVLECAAASGCEYIVTHNIKDFRRIEQLKLRAVTPAEFLTLLRNKP